MSPEKPSIGFRWDLPAEKAIQYLKSKDYRISFDYRDMMKEEHDTAFTVAKMADMDLLKDVHQAVKDALEKGETLADFKEKLIPLMQDKGWWGRKTMIDPKTGEEKEVQLGSPRRLKTIFQTNLSTAYMAGKWQNIQEMKTVFPYLLYDAVDDERTRPEHARWDGLVLKVDDPWWKTHYPPNGWGCRCSVIQMNDRMLARRGLKPSEKAPSDGTYPWKNPRTGEIEEIPKGIDPGWNYSPGASRKEVERLFEERAHQVEKDLDLPENFIKMKPAERERSREPKGKDLEKNRRDAEKMGVDADYGESETAGTMMNEAMKTLISKGFPLPKKIGLSGEAFEGLKEAEDAVGNYNHHDDTISLNPSFDWDNAKNEGKRQFDFKMWETDRPDHPDLHELGHQVHFKRSKTAYLQMPLWHPDIAMKVLNGKVSDTALESPREFVAEIFCGLISGKKYDSIILKWYNFYGGPKVDD